LTKSNLLLRTRTIVVLLDSLHLTLAVVAVGRLVAAADRGVLLRADVRHLYADPLQIRAAASTLHVAPQARLALDPGHAAAMLARLRFLVRTLCAGRDQARERDERSDQHSAHAHPRSPRESCGCYHQARPAEFTPQPPSAPGGRSRIRITAV